jgi:nickel/cobalt transporter (NiCoT) family protein
MRITCICARPVRDLLVVGFALLASASALGLGIGITAYTLGLRHAFDADHIGAIDNTTRKLMSEGQRPLSVGFFFSLGHSTIVFALAALFAVGVRGLSGAVERDDSTLHQAAGLIGPVVSGAFLFLIGILNLIILVSIVGIFRRMRDGRRATRAVRKPWQMYPLGCLFGLGFDTRPRSRCSRPPEPRPRAACRSTRSSACRSSSPPECRCSTRSTAPS